MWNVVSVDSTKSVFSNNLGQEVVVKGVVELDAYYVEEYRQGQLDCRWFAKGEPEAVRNFCAVNFEDARIQGKVKGIRRSEEGVVFNGVDSEDNLLTWIMADGN